MINEEYERVRMKYLESVAEQTLVDYEELKGINYKLNVYDSKHLQ